jgi:A/G-specific adenine glycosylase
VETSDSEWESRLVDWYLINKRDMPWRSDPTPYKVWISEMMLQQTQVATVIPYFNRFIKQFPSVSALAKAPLTDVLKCWEGLGYYSRARNLHKAANIVITKYNGNFPSDKSAMLALPGIGPYCCAAIASIAFGQPLPVVDGNVLRVFTRFWGINEDIRRPQVRDDIFKRLSPPILKTDPSSFNQGIMELGATLCTPKKPDCNSCPLSPSCVAFLTDKTNELPFKSKSKPVPHHDIGVGVIWKKNKILIGRRPENKMLGGLWEFPGGKKKESETITETIEREVEEETQLKVKATNEICTVKHAYTHFKITLHVYKCALLSGEEKPISADELKWVTLRELEKLPFPKANIKALAEIKKVKRA